MTNQKQLSWRRDKVHEYLVKGLSQNEITDLLKVSKSTISSDVAYLRILAKEEMKNYMEEKLPKEFNTAIRGLNDI